MMSKMEISDVELDALIELFQALFEESMHQGSLCEQNGDKEELLKCYFLSNLYLKMLSYLHSVAGQNHE